MNKRRLTWRLLGLVLTLAVVSGQADQVKAADKVTPAAGKGRPRAISVAGGPSGGTYFLLASGLAQLLPRYIGGLTVNAEASSASPENARLVGTKKVELSMVVADVAHFATKGAREFREAYTIRAVLAGTASPVHLMVPANSPIKSIRDLRGKRVSLGPKGAASNLIVEALLGVYDIKDKDYSKKYVNASETASAIGDGLVDAAFFLAQAPAAAVREAATTAAIRLISIEPDMLKRAQQDHPYWGTGLIKAGTYNRVETDTTTIALQVVLITHADVDEELVYQMTKAIAEHTNELGEVHPDGRAFTAENAKNARVIPLHPGALRYLREKGVM